ncbi:hypothetical protein BDV06DRAFT_228979 [Aspergillus oleicola]
MSESDPEFDSDSDSDKDFDSDEDSAPDTGYHFADELDFHDRRDNEGEAASLHFYIVDSDTNKPPITHPVGDDGATSCWGKLGFSSCGKYLLFLHASLVLESAYSDVHLRFSVYQIGRDEQQGLVLKSAEATQSITYRIGCPLLALPWDLILTHWTENGVIAALPLPPCKPKFVRFTMVTPAGMNEIGENTAVPVQPSLPVETLRDAVYFPSLSTRNARLLYQTGKEGKDHELFLFLQLIRPSKGHGIDDGTNAVPVLIRWKIAREQGVEELEPGNRHDVL